MNQIFFPLLLKMYIYIFSAALLCAEYLKPACADLRYQIGIANEVSVNK